jgi:MGT family glycosyltransferase
MSARVLFSCWPFEGHVYPQMSMALALRDRGAEVAFYTHESMRDLIEGQGFELLPFRQVPPAWQRVHGAERDTTRRRSAQLRAALDWLVGTIPAQVADLQDVTARWRPDVIGTEASMWGPLLVLADLESVPVAMVSPLIGAEIPGPDAPLPLGLGPQPRTTRARLLRSAAAPVATVLTAPMRRRIDAIRADHGLGRMGCSVHAYIGRRPLYLVLSVPELDYHRHDLPPAVHYVGPCLWHPPEPPGTIEWLEALPRERPWVHVTEGTSHFGDHFILRAAAEGLAGAPLEAIVTTGRACDPREAGLEAPADNVHVAEWLSHDVLLPRCAAIVTTGGMGTVMAALTAGVPLVVVPTADDKPAAAHRVAAAGVGVRLAPRRCTPEALRAAVQEVLTDPRYRRNARRAGDLLAAAPGPAGAAELIAGLTRSTDAGEPAGTERLAT